MENAVTEIISRIEGCPSLWAMSSRSASMQGCPGTWLGNQNYPYLPILTLVACYKGKFQMNSK